MEINLFTSGKNHYVVGYGKNNLLITTAPSSILKKIVDAACFEVIRSNENTDHLPLIQLKEEYKAYVKVESKSLIDGKNDEVSYNLSLCTRMNELLRFYTNKTGERHYSIERLLQSFGGEEKGYRIGARYGKTGLQLFIVNDSLSLLGKDIEGKKLRYPFLMNEFEAEVSSLIEQAELYKIEE